MSATRLKSRVFSAVETCVFDLDNTLYPHHLNLWQQVDERIRDYVARFLRITKDEAFHLQKDYYRRYGTTMRGLMTEHGLQPDDYLEFVHQIDHSPLVPNPALGAAIEKLPGRKLIMTNGTRKHAEAVMARLEIRRHFEDVFDIAAATSSSRCRGVTCPAVVVENRPLLRIWHAISVPHVLGMTTVLRREGTRECSAKTGRWKAGLLTSIMLR